MEQWSSYDLSDFLLFSAETYWRLFERHNQAMWPAQIAALIAGAFVLFAVIKPSPTKARGVFAILALAWLMAAYAFFWQRYPTINWASSYIAPLIALQGILLALCAVGKTVPDVPTGPPTTKLVAITILVISLAGYPLVAPLLGQSWMSAEIFALHPDPTATTTLAVLAMHSGRALWIAWLVPMLWCVATGLTLWALGSPAFLLAPALATCAIFATAIRTART